MLRSSKYLICRNKPTSSSYWKIAAERTVGKFKGSVSELTSIQASVSAMFSSVRSSEHLPWEAKQITVAALLKELQGSHLVTRWWRQRSPWSAHRQAGLWPEGSAAPGSRPARTAWCWVRRVHPVHSLYLSSGWTRTGHRTNSVLQTSGLKPCWSVARLYWMLRRDCGWSAERRRPIIVPRRGTIWGCCNGAEKSE